MARTTLIIQKDQHCVRSVHIQYFPAFGLNTERYAYFSAFSPNTGKYGLEKLQIRTLFTQCKICGSALKALLISITASINLRKSLNQEFGTFTYKNQSKTQLHDILKA